MPVEPAVTKEPPPTPEVETALAGEPKVELAPPEPASEVTPAASSSSEDIHFPPEAAAVMESSPAIVAAGPPAIEPVAEADGTTRSAARDLTSQDFDRVFGSYGTDDDTAKPGLRTWLGRVLGREPEAATSAEGRVDPPGEDASPPAPAFADRAGQQAGRLSAGGALPPPRREKPVSLDEVRADIRECLDVLHRLQEDRRARFG